MHKKTLEGILEEFPDEKEAIVEATTKQRARNQAANIALMAHKRALTKRIGSKWLNAARRRSRTSSLTGSLPDLGTLVEEDPDKRSQDGSLDQDQHSFLEVRQTGEETEGALEMMMSMRPHNTAPLRDKEWRARRSSLARVSRRDSSVSQHSDGATDSPTEMAEGLDGGGGGSSGGGLGYAHHASATCDGLPLALPHPPLSGEASD